jgi:hypothetical protein
MVREIINISLKHAVFSKYNDRCYVCGFSLIEALRIHHIIPVSLGGSDSIENLALLCSNCHTLTHFFSSNRFNNKNIATFFEQEYGNAAIRRMNALIQKIRHAKYNIEKNNNRWIQDKLQSKPFSIQESIQIVAHKNRYSVDKTNQLRDVLVLVIRNIPDWLRNKCSYRLLKYGRYISINIMNYLIFRSPGYGDFGQKPKHDCILIFPNKTKRHEHVGERIEFIFKHFNCLNIGFSFNDILSFSKEEWKYFMTACKMASAARRSRSWISNIDIELIPNVSCHTY